MGFSDSEISELKEKSISSEMKFEGEIIKLRVDTVKLPNGNQASREIVEHPGGVGIVALTEKNEVLMVRQYRRPFDSVILEIPAGKLNYGEDPLSCGKRELEEETGYTANEFVFLGNALPTPGFCEEIQRIYLATGLKRGAAHPDEDEFLTVEKIPLSDLVSAIMKNEISDSKTQIGILKANEWLREKMKK